MCHLRKEVHCVPAALNCTWFFSSSLRADGFDPANKKRAMRSLHLQSCCFSCLGSSAVCRRLRQGTAYLLHYLIPCHHDLSKNWALLPVGSHRPLCV